jgi:hypothetical protein
MVSETLARVRELEKPFTFDPLSLSPPATFQDKFLKDISILKREIREVLLFGGSPPIQEAWDAKKALDGGRFAEAAYHLRRAQDRLRGDAPTPEDNDESLPWSP